MLVTLGSCVDVQQGDMYAQVAASELFEVQMIASMAPTACITALRFPIWDHLRIGTGFLEVSARQSDYAYVEAAAQMAQTRNALAFLEEHPHVHSNPIGCMGSSFGAAVTIYAAGVDERIACAISADGWGNGVSKFRRQHPTEETWARFTAMLEEGKRHRAQNGQSLLAPRYEIVPIPEHRKHNVVKASIQMFPAETAQRMFEFRANDEVGKIAPRPLLLLHPSRDSVTPTQQSIGLFIHPGQPTEMHLIQRRITSCSGKRTRACNLS